MRVLVTGGSSLLGGATARALAARGEEVTLLQRRPTGLGLREVLGDIRDAEVVAAAAAGQEAIVHLAAKVGIVGSPEDFETVNVGGTTNVLEAARAVGVRRVVHVSTPSVAHAGRPLVGAPAAPADPTTARGAYARTKAVAERLALVPRDDLDVVAIRPHLVWGPGDTQLVARIVARARSGRLALIDDGAALIDTTYLDNAVDSLLAAVDRVSEPDVRGRPFVVSNGQPRTVAELVARICDAAGVARPRRHVPLPVAWSSGVAVERLWARLDRDDDPPMTTFLAEQLATAHWFDQRETRRALRWTPAIDLATGFDRLRTWFDSADLR